MKGREHGFYRAAVPVLVAWLTAAGTGCAAATFPRAYGVGSATAGNAPLTVRLSARVTSEPAHLVVRTWVAPDARNRELMIQWFNDAGVGGSHSISLEGDQSAVRHDCTIRSMAAGEYVVTAVLARSDGRSVQRVERVVVLGEGRDSEGRLAAVGLSR